MVGKDETLGMRCVEQFAVFVGNVFKETQDFDRIEIFHGFGEMRLHLGVVGFGIVEFLESLFGQAVFVGFMYQLESCTYFAYCPVLGLTVGADRQPFGFGCDLFLDHQITVMIGQARSQFIQEQATICPTQKNSTACLQGEASGQRGGGGGDKGRREAQAYFADDLECEMSGFEESVVEDWHAEIHETKVAHAGDGVLPTGLARGAFVSCSHA